MGFSDFWINNNGKKEQLNNGKHGVRKEQVDKKFHNLFDAYDVNGDGTLENEELQGIFTGLTKFSGTDKTLDSVENKQVSILFENQAGIKDADFMGFVKSVSDASEEIVSSSTTKGVDGGNVITTTYKNGMVETIYYYPDGEFKLKTQKQDSVTETTTYYYTNDGKNYKQCSKAELNKMIKADYKKYKAANSQNSTRRNDGFSSINIIMGPDVHKSDYMKRHDVNPCTNRSEIHIDNTDMSDRAQAEAEIRDFVVSHFVQTHKDCQSALDTMGILDDIGAAINAGAGELWNSCKNIYNKHFGDGTESDYQNFYELVKKFEPNYGKALVAEGSLAEMRVHPVGYFTGETGKIDVEKGLQFQQTTERYQNATILKSRIDILKDAMLEISMYENEQNALTYAPAQSEGMNPASHILKANNLLLQYFDGDKEAVNMLLSGTIGNAQSTINAIKGIADDTQKMFDAVTNGKSFDEIKNDYQTQYKAIYGTDFVPDELTEKVMDAKATGGMVKLAAITAISILITKSPVMAEISAAAGGAEVTGAAANMIRTLASRYGATAVQQGIKFAMTSGTLATDVGLTLLNQVTSERGVNGEELWESAKGSAKYIYFGAYIGAPLAQAVSKQLGKIGATAKLFEGGVKSANGAIQTTSITGEKLVQNLMKGGNKVLTTGGAFLTDVAAFSALEVATEGMDPLTAGKEQTEMLGKLKIMNHFIEYMLGGKVHAGMSKAQMDATIERSGVKNWQIKEIKAPNKTVYEVEVGEGLPPMRFEDKNQLATAMLERVTANYSESAKSQTRTQTTKPEGEVKATPETEVETETSQQPTIIQRLETANDRESFVAIRDEIKKLPNGEEKTQLIQEYLKKYNEWTTAPERPDIRMEYKNELENNDILNQDTDEVRTMINNTITRLRQTSNGKDITLKINGEEQVYQAYKGNLGNNGSYYVTDGKNIYTILPIQSKAMCEEKILADKLYSQLLGCFSKEAVVVETDTGYGIMTKSYFSKSGFSRNKAIVKTYAMDALLGNMENVVVNTTGSDPITASNNAMINLLHHPNGNPKMGQAIVPELSLMFQQNGNNAKDLKSASKEELVASLQQVVDIPNKKLLEIVNNSKVENKEQLGNLLIQRKAFIGDFLNNLKNTEQAGLPIEEFMLKVYQKTYAEYKYDNLKSKGNTEFTEFISEKFDIPKSDLLGYQKILNNSELAEHITQKINDGLISKEDLIEFNEEIGNFAFYWQESPTLKKEIFDTLLELKNEQGINMKDGYLLILKIVQNDRAGQFSKDAVGQIKIINRELNGNTNAGLYRIILNEGTINQEKLDFIKDIQNRGIEDKHLVLLTEHILNPDRTINNEKLTALKGLFDNNINPEDIPMYFTAINTPEGLDAKMLLIVDKYKELGFDNDNITRNILSSRVRTKEGFIQKTHALELPLLFPEEIANAKLLNDAVREFSLWTPSVENQIKSAIEKNPNIKLADLVGFMQTLHKNNTFDSDGFSTGFRLLQDGVASDNLSSFIAVSKITANSINNLTPEEALKQTIRLRSTGEILLDHDLTPIQVARLLDVAKTGGQIDKFALDIIENQFNNYTSEELLCLINYSKVIPQDGVPLEVTNNQRQQILDNITDIMKNKGCSVIDACKSISPALNLRKIGLSKSEIIGINENTLSFCRKCAENDIAAGDIQLLAYNSKILDNVSNFSPEELSAKQQQMLSWADKLLFEDKLPAKTVAKFIDVAAFKTSGKIGVRPATYNFDNNVINIINRMISEKAITSESSADISKVILAFKTLDYDENAIAKAIDLLKNPITLKNGKQYNMDAESIGYFVGGSKNKETGKFDIDIFNRNVDIYILKAEHGFSIQEMVMLSKLYKNELTINRLSTAQKVNLLNKISYASKDAIELIQEKVIETKNPDGSITNGEIDVLTRKLLTDINLASRNIRTNQTQRQEFLRNFISNKGRNPETGLNNIETKISEFDFTQYGKEGLPLKYSRDEFIANIQQILENLSPEDKAAVLKFHNIDLGENGFNSNPRIRQFNQPVEFLTNDGYKNIINELSTILKGVNEDNLQIFKENNIDTIVKKCMQLSTLDDVKISELETEFPELKFDTIKELQQKAREFAELTSNNDVDNLPTPLAVKTANEEIEAFNNFSPEIKKASERIEEEYKKFMYENEFQTDDPELNNILNGIMRGLPDVMLTVGKKQHQTHAYSVDVHTMEVLKKAMNDPEYKTLSDSDRTILKFSILLHDFGKKYINPTTPDTGHEIDSAEIASGIMAQFKLSAKVKERILNIIKNHDWFARYNKNEWNANKVAALFRSPDDYKIAKIMSKADLFSINPDFQYSPRVLNITENRTIENASKVFDQKLENLDAAYQKMYAKTNIVMNSKILNAAKIPMDEQYGVRVLNLTDENIPSDMDLGQYGMNGTTKDNLRLTVHMVAEDNLLGNLESAKLGMETTTNDNNVWSISMIKMDRTRTYMHREYGFATDTPISSIAIASPNNLSSGYEKGTDKFVELLFTDNPQRNFLKQKFIQSAYNQGSRISEADYQELSRLVYNKSFLSQLETKTEIEVNGNIYPTSAIVKAIQESTDALFTGQTHTEFVATNPKIQGLVVRKNSMDEVAPDFIAFAKKYNLPILLVGNK